MKTLIQQSTEGTEKNNEKPQFKDNHTEILTKHLPNTSYSIFINDNYITMSYQLPKMLSYNAKTLLQDLYGV